MHVLYVTTTYPPENGWGGIGTYVYHMARGMIARGHRVTVLCGFQNAPHVGDEQGVCVIRQLDERRTLDGLQMQIAALVPGIIEERKIDVTEFAEYGALGLLFQKQHPQSPCVIRLHGGSFYCASHEPWWLLQARRLVSPAFYRQDARERDSVRLAYAVTACSQWMLDKDKSRGWPLPTNSQTIFNPFWTDILPKENIGDNRKVNTVLWLARLDRQKGADLLPAIITRVLREFPEARFEVVGQDRGRRGGGSWQRWIFRQLSTDAKGRVVFLGGLAHDEVMRRLQSYQIAVFASAVESFGYSHVECLASGLACVLASIGGAAELGEHGTHFLRTPRTAGAIAKAVVELLRNKVMREGLAMAAVRHVREQFDTTRIAKETEPVYEVVIRQAGKVLS